MANLQRALAVPEGLDGLRLDVAVARLFGLSRTGAGALVDRGSVRCEGVPRARSDRVRAGEWLDVCLDGPEPPAEHAAGPVDGLRVVHEDPDLVVIDKPPGVAAHPSPGYTGPDVLSGLRALGYVLTTAGPDERQGIVHRLDVGTSGLMVVARSTLAYRVLKEAFRDRRVDKGYHAVVQGHPDPSRGTVDAPIDRHPTQSYRFAVVAGGRPSVTHYDTVEATRAASLLEVRLETGRTHQIRVHLAAVRHPCVGDLTYGADPSLAARLELDRQWLHAFRLGFAHPAGGRWVEFTSEVPADLDRAWRRLRGES